jgi:hypothetical protein
MKYIALLLLVLTSCGGSESYEIQYTFCGELLHERANIISDYNFYRNDPQVGTQIAAIDTLLKKCTCGDTLYRFVKR